MSRFTPTNASSVLAQESRGYGRRTDAAGHLAAVEAVADVATSLFAEEVVVVDFDRHSFEELVLLE